MQYPQYLKYIRQGLLYRNHKIDLTQTVSQETNKQLLVRYFTYRKPISLS